MSKQHMAGREVSEPSTELGRNIETMRKKAGITVSAMCKSAKISRATLGRIYNGESKEPKVLPRIAKAIGCEVGDFYGSTMTFDLSNAPVCESEYYLDIENAKLLGFSDFPEGPVTVLVVPFEASQKQYPVRLVYRYTDHDEALIVENVRLGSRFVQVPVGTHAALPPEFRPTQDNGMFLGAIADIVSLPHIFYRTS